MAEKETHPIRNAIIAGVIVAIIALFLPAVRNWKLGTLPVFVRCPVFP